MIGDHRTSLAVALVVAACGSSPPPASNRGSSPPPMGADKGGVPDEAAAIKLLEQRLGTKCVGYQLEVASPEAFEIAQREIHGGECPGDPQTSPVAGRYRVARDGKVSKMDPVSAEWQLLDR